MSRQAIITPRLATIQPRLALTQPRLATIGRTPDGLLNGLVESWQLSEASSPYIGSVSYTPLGVGSSAISSVAAKVGNGLSFVSASSQWVSGADNPNHSFAGDFTILCWVNFTTVTGTQHIINKGNAGGFQFAEYMLRFAGGVFNFKVGNGVSTVTLNGAAPATGTWYFIAAWLDTTAQTINLQVNNGSISSTACTITSYDSNAGLRLGRDLGGGTNFLNLILNQVSLYNRVLLPSERSGWYNNGNGLAYPGYM